MSGECQQIELTNNLEELARLEAWLASWAEQMSVDSKTLFQLNLVCDELVTNTILYGCQSSVAHSIRISIWVDMDNIELTITDDGMAFDPLSLPSPDVQASVEERRIGGLGIHFVRESMDEAIYERVDKLNILHMKKIGWKTR
ncbi:MULTISPECIES: ATP-binding protein [Paenibacillus]|uniref:ATP-binding protein n=1 Tax=Paenibacillus baimaensis TaxID=2982185 RepID=A0ABT2UAL6_9BACL|nr:MULTISPECIES: ATP-binding protein [unclassified Paenibacillus]MCU6791689.1 ATP-binding protein [Paenibacillus sp. WQ 127069]